MRDNLFDGFTPQTGTHCTHPSITTNGYYGYQPQRGQAENKSVECEMEVDSNSASQNVNTMGNNSQPLSRKRLSTEPIETQTFKKRRQNGNFQPSDSSVPKFGRKPTHHLPDIPRSIFGHF